jgi:hypothetical protein
MHTFVNRNYLIPTINTYDIFEDAIRKLHIETYSRNNDYNKNVYMISNDNKFYKSDGKAIYVSNLNNLDNSILFYNFSTVNVGNLNLILNYTQENTNTNTNTNTNNSNSENNMNITFENKKTNTVRFETNNLPLLNQDIFEKKNNVSEKSTKNEETVLEKQEESLEKSELDNKKESVLKMIEEVNDLYQKEVSNMKRLELNLKTYNTKLKKLEQKKKDDSINNIIRTQTEYRTWKKIKYGIKTDNPVEEDLLIIKPIEELEESDEQVPILFLSKYNYLDKIQTNESIRKLLDEINQLELDKLYTDNTLPEDKILQFCNKYMILSKELHYQFDHEWDWLEDEMNLNSTNKISSFTDSNQVKRNLI